MSLPFPILFEDEAIIVCKKPANIPTQSKNIRTPDMETLLLTYLSTKGLHYLGVIHRLDTPVAGVMVFAKTPLAAKDLSKQISEKKMKKIYEATIKGELSPAKGTLIDYLKKDGRTNTSKVVPENTPGGKKAILHYQVLSFDEKENTSLLEIHLETGRHHQIRLQLASRKHPLVGDSKYGEKNELPLMLVAKSLSFKHPLTHKKMTFTL
ncbi:MAG TPA: RluA family pseudouridine synthase [Candidatus Dorea intestinavium]|nr:RluA family pseudouridine synthase [Candidatus Dorea intestinavium]